MVVSAVHRLYLACAARDRSAIVRLLDPQVTAVIDSGGRVPAWRVPVVGPERVAALLLEILTQQPTVISRESVNGRPGLVLRAFGRVTGVLSVDVHSTLVTTIWIVLNPDKLRHWNIPG